MCNQKDAIVLEPDHPGGQTSRKFLARAGKFAIKQNLSVVHAQLDGRSDVCARSQKMSGKGGDKGKVGKVTSEVGWVESMGSG